jgi:hypothetical protein
MEREEEEEANNINNNSNNDNFYIHGWRWHTQALARDARRLAQLATNTIIDDIDENKIDDLQQAIEYTVQFNMKGLHKIERDVFFPWVRTTVVPAIPDHDVTSRKRLGEVMDQLERDHWQLHEWGQALVRVETRGKHLLLDADADADCLFTPCLLFSFDLSHGRLTTYTPDRPVETPRTGR